jgi:NhaP-type Na+/H+ or K+/H+ antiporter
MGDDQDNQGDDDQQYSPGDDNENWVDSEAGIDLYFVIFLTLLAVVLTCAKFLRDRPRIAAILPEAGMIIVVGALSGALLSFAMLPLSRGDAAEDDDGENDNRNKFVAEGLLSFSPKVFFFVLLPPIIFNSGYCLKHEVFFRHITPISLFACAGTAISTFAIAAILELLKSCGLLGEFAPKFTELMTFGALSE